MDNPIFNRTLILIKGGLYDPPEDQEVIGKIVVNLFHPDAINWDRARETGVSALIK